MTSVVLLVVVLAGLVGAGAVLGYEFARFRGEVRVVYVAPSLWPVPVRAVFALADLGVDPGPGQHVPPGREDADRAGPPVLVAVEHDSRARRLLLTYSDGRVVELDEQLNDVNVISMRATG